jgi:hypothetical protein
MIDYSFFKLGWVMSSEEKIIQKIFEGRKVSYKDVERVLLNLGFELNIKGSHHIFRKKGCFYNISLKRRSELVRYQIKIVQEVLEDHGYTKKD